MFVSCWGFVGEQSWSWDVELCRPEWRAESQHSPWDTHTLTYDLHCQPLSSSNLVSVRESITRFVRRYLIRFYSALCATNWLHGEWEHETLTSPQWTATSTVWIELSLTNVGNWARKYCHCDAFCEKENKTAFADYSKVAFVVYNLLWKRAHSACVKVPRKWWRRA